MPSDIKLQGLLFLLTRTQPTTSASSCLYDAWQRVCQGAVGWPQVTEPVSEDGALGLSQHWPHVSVTFLAQNPTIYCLLLFRLNVFKRVGEALQYISILISGCMPYISVIYETVVKIILNPWHNSQLSMKALSWTSVLTFNFEFMVWI